jgi:Leucine-rich repeat (LRR) protein
MMAYFEVGETLMKLRVALLTMALIVVAGPRLAAQQRIEELVDTSAVNVIQRMGGTVFPESACRVKRDVETVSLPTASDDDLKYLVPFLKRLPRLKKVSLAHNPRITDAGLAALRDLPNLEGLDLNYTNIGDPGMEHVKALTRLQELRLSHTRVSNAGVDTIRGLSDLRTLVLSSTGITDPALETVKGFSKLETLKLCSTAITDKGLDALKDLKALRVLTIHNTNISDVAIANLKKVLLNLVVDTGRQA